MDPGEECDDGNTSNTDACLTDCRRATCGDGYVWTGHEECDDGNVNSGDGCSADCVVEFCGDGTVQSGIGEECEPGVSGTRNCTTTCGTTGTQSCNGQCKWGPCAPPTETCNGQDDDCDGSTDDLSCLSVVHLFYNPTTGDHMVKVDTTSPDPGYTLETAYWYIYNVEVPNTFPIYQVFDGTDHMVTLDPNEGSPNYGNPQFLGYMSDRTWEVGSVTFSQICRYYNTRNGDHTAYRALTTTEMQQILGPDYVREGCMFGWGFHGQ